MCSCSVLQCVAVCCSVFWSQCVWQFVAVCCSVFYRRQKVDRREIIYRERRFTRQKKEKRFLVAVCVAVCCSVFYRRQKIYRRENFYRKKGNEKRFLRRGNLLFVAVCVAGCCSVCCRLLQCVAVCSTQGQISTKERNSTGR